VPEHNVSFVSFSDRQEADYFCAVFNSSVIRLTAISSYSGGGGGIVSPKVLERLFIPQFTRNSQLHKELSALSQRAHKLASAAYGGDEAARAELQQVEQEVFEATITDRLREHFGMEE